MGLTTCVRGAVIVSTLVPRLALITWLGWTGYQWLFLTLRYTDVILRVLVLKFILNIDDILYEACWPHSYKRKVQNSSVVRTASAEGAQSSRSEMLKAMWLTASLTCLCVLYVLTSYSVPQAQRGCNLNS